LVFVDNKVDGAIIEIPGRTDMKIGQVRKKVADSFEIPFSSFQLIVNERAFNMSNNDSPIKDAKYFQVKEYTDIEEDPKAYLSESQEYIEKLLSLLSKDNVLYTESIWHILNILPCNQKLKENIEKVEVIL
jgi:hypothetical protein